MDNGARLVDVGGDAAWVSQPWESPPANERAVERKRTCKIATADTVGKHARPAAAHDCTYMLFRACSQIPGTTSTWFHALTCQFDFVQLVRRGVVLVRRMGRSPTRVEVCDGHLT